MKRILALALVVVLSAVALASCSKEVGNGVPTVDGGVTDGTTENTTENTENVGETVETSDGTPELEPMDVLEFVSNHHGTWTSEGNSFVKFFAEDGNGYIFFAIWDAGGYFPCGRITELYISNNGSIYATLYVPEVEGDEFMEGAEAYTIECIIESFDLSVSVEIDGKVTVYTYDPDRQF